MCNNACRTETSVIVSRMNPQQDTANGKAGTDLGTGLEEQVVQLAVVGLERGAEACMRARMRAVPRADMVTRTHREASSLL